MRLTWVAKLPTFWSKRESKSFTLYPMCPLTELAAEESVLESGLLLRSSSSNVCPALSRGCPADERVPDVIRTNLASCPFDRFRSWCRLRGLRPFLQPRQDTWHPNSPGFRTTQAIERRLLPPEVAALVVSYGYDLVLERKRDQHHNTLRTCSPHPP